MATIYTENQYRHIIASLSGHPELSDWEVGFVRSVSFSLSIGRQMSASQLATLSRLWDRVDGSQPPNTPPPV
jgi:hypothetical protein